MHMSNKWYYGPVSGINYWNQVILTDYSCCNSAFTIYRNGSGTIPGSWSSGQTTLYRNGTVCKSQGLYSNPSDTVGWTGSGAGGNCGSGTYNTRGSTGAWNSAMGSFNYYYTDTSPSVTY